MLSFSFIACKQTQCESENTVFIENEPNSKAYKDELVKKLENTNTAELSYILQDYQEENGIEYLYFRVQGKDLCAKLVLTMTQWNNLEKIRDKKAVSYRGTEFTNLQYEIQQDSSATNFIYASYGKMID